MMRQIRSDLNPTKLKLHTIWETKKKEAVAMYRKSLGTLDSVLWSTFRYSQRKKKLTSKQSLELFGFELASLESFQALSFQALSLPASSLPTSSQANLASLELCRGRTYLATNSTNETPEAISAGHCLCFVYLSVCL